ncbi:MAG: hypothetical protein WCJ24_03455 [Candidatus Saccharibacteria bacterium]
MRRYLLAFSAMLMLSAGMILAIPRLSAAQSPFDAVCSTGDGSASTSSTICKGKNESTNPITGKDGILVKAVELLNLVIAVVAVFVIVISGIRFVTSSGDTQNVSNAKNAILYAVIGLVVAFSAQAIITFVINKL